MKFRKKVVFDAIQWYPPTDPPDGTEVVMAHGATVKYRNPQSAYKDTGIGFTAGWWSIITLEGQFLVQAGDWIIKGVGGDFYPCRQALFEQTYEPAV
jgi:hypothetical protein